MPCFSSSSSSIPLFSQIPLFSFSHFSHHKSFRNFNQKPRIPMLMASEEEKPIQEVLSLPILLADRVIKSAQEAESSKPENSELARQVTHLSQLLRSAARLTTTATASYDRPIRRVAVGLTKALERAFSLTRKCRHRKTNVLHHVLSITTTADFKKVSTLIDSSLADIKWVLSIFDPESSDFETLPPIATTTDPILAWVWPHIAAVHSGRAESARQLATLAKDSERYRKIIVDEIGIPPLLKMLKDSGNVDAQSAAACALCNLADDENRVSLIAKTLGVQIIVKAIVEFPMTVQVILVDLVSRMCEWDANVKEEFGKENVTRPLVTLLGMDVDFDEFVEANSRKSADCLLSVVQINKEMARKGIGSYGSGNSLEGSGNSKHQESPELKMNVRVRCAIALSRLASGSLLNSRKITDTKALLVLAKIIEKEEGVLKMNCLMVLMELAAVAEMNTELKRYAFKPTSTAAKAVFDQLLRVINEDKGPEFVVPAIGAIGCLASMFPAKEKRIVQSLVAKIGHRDLNVGNEAAKALSKFVCDDNFNRKEHCQTIIESNGVMKLINLLRSDERGGGPPSRLDELVLLCYLAINVGNSKAFEQGRALSLLERAAKHVVSQHPESRELFAKAIHQLTIYQVGVHGHRQV